jgi:uncharacterized membrane protein YtjA (UPF0391 family)
MLYRAGVFLVLAILSAAIGFADVAAGVAGAARVLLIVFLVLAGVSMLLGPRLVA